MKSLRYILIIFIFISIAASKDTNYQSDQKLNSSECLKQYEDIPVIDLRDLHVTPYPTRFEEKSTWVIDNLNNFQGWSFTGYAHTYLDKNFNVVRWKFGMISEVIDYDIQNFYRENGFDHRKRKNSMIFGIGFNRQF